MSRPFRLAYLVSHPIQYQAPLLRHLARLPELELTVFFLSDLSLRGYHDPGFGREVRWDVPLTEGYRHVFLESFGGRDRLDGWRPLARGLRRRLREGGFEALWVHGYAHPSLLLGVLAARSLGIRVLLRGESHLTSQARGGPGRALRRVLLARLFAQADGLLAIGSRNRDYYLSHGVPAARIHAMPYAVDNDYFSSRAAAAAASRESLRAELGLAPGRPVLLFASKLVGWKRPHDLLEAFARLPSDPGAHLVFVGDGEARPGLERRAAALPAGAVRFLGFRNQSELPRFYDLCDALVLPSEYEPWGLVLNEVMNAGRPVVVSDRVGAAADLVRDGVNGYVVPGGSVEALGAALQRLLEDDGRRAAMGAESKARIRAFSFEADAAGLLSALAAVCPR